MSPFTEACCHNVQIILYKINVIQMYLVNFNGNKPQRNNKNTLLQFPIVNSRIKKF